ncbi:MAG: glycogen synthase GlgA [Alphaproteobacteria bacterium]|nr:glycogen synthase GlgA [Alphaproteobacteria bacterium]
MSGGPRVLHVAAEIFPWVKTGGLGDVMAALPPALAAQGVDVRVIVPGFTALLDALPLTDSVRLRTPFSSERVRIGLAPLPGSAVKAYLVDYPAFYDRPGGPYQAPDGGEWGDNHRRFALLCWAAAALAQGADPNWRPQIVQCHDWHAGLTPAYMRAANAGVPSIFTVHNLAYQGYFGAGAFADLALPPEMFSVEGIEYYGGLSFIKAGLYYASRLTTVSPTYAREIQTPAFGMNIDGLLRTRTGVLTGILNGVDPAIWSPENDALLPRRYGVEAVEDGKAAAKQALRQRFGLGDMGDGPLFGAITRLTWQKGFDIMLQALPGLVDQGGSFVLLGSGDRGLEDGFRAVAQAYPGRVSAEIGYDEALAHLITAGSDSILVPSRFEPCGLTQLYALRYGSLPVVRQTGGLADTVVDANSVTLADDSATGFAFDGETPDALIGSVQRAATLYRADPSAWRRVQRNAMRRDFSWAAAARQYGALYRDLLNARD